MKFQNPSFKYFLNGRTDNGRTSRKQYAPHFYKVGGIKTEPSNKKIMACHYHVSYISADRPAQCCTIKSGFISY